MRIWSIPYLKNFVWVNSFKLYTVFIKCSFVILTSQGSPPASVSGGKDLPVSAGVQAPAKMPRSGNEVMSK